MPFSLHIPSISESSIPDSCIFFNLIWHFDSTCHGHSRFRYMRFDWLKSEKDGWVTAGAPASTHSIIVGIQPNVTIQISMNLHDSKQFDIKNQKKIWTIRDIWFWNRRDMSHVEKIAYNEVHKVTVHCNFFKYLLSTNIWP